jgi:hypothetical protein
LRTKSTTVVGDGAGWCGASVQQVAPVDDHIDFAGASGLERALEIVKEVITPSTPDHARPGGPVETDVLCVPETNSTRMSYPPGRAGELRSQQRSEPSQVYVQ